MHSWKFPLSDTPVNSTPILLDFAGLSKQTPREPNGRIGTGRGRDGLKEISPLQPVPKSNSWCSLYKLKTSPAEGIMVSTYLFMCRSVTLKSGALYKK
jgi:hypothetical protein